MGKFGRGSDEAITGACAECQNGRHTACKSLREVVDMWPRLDDDDLDLGNHWTCPCLEHFDEVREDYDKHHGVMER